LPDGSIIYFDGEGRRETFRAVTNEEGVLLAKLGNEDKTRRILWEIDIQKMESDTG